ncbi:MAG: 50S ribosomal protein L3 [Phycisphaerales bacterium]
MSLTLLGRKVGMTRYFQEDGTNVPVTLIEVGPCIVTQVRTPDVDGYAAVQIGFGEAKPRATPIPQIGHDAKAGTTPKRTHLEFRVDEKDLGNYELGQALTLEALGTPAFVDVIGTSKGKGFTGTMKRWNFKGQQASHGVERKHRSPGSIGGHGSNRGLGGGLRKGKKMSGQLGAERITVRSLDVVHVDAEKNLLLVKGPIPGPNNGEVQVRMPTRLYKSKARKQAEALKG